MKARNIFFKITIWIIFSLTGIRIIQFVFRFYALFIMQQVSGGSQPYERLQPVMEEYKIEQIISTVLMVAWLICFSIWFYISYKRVQQHSRQSFSYKPILALFSLIIPIFNIFAPYKIMQEIWTANNRDMSQEETGRKLINTWWFLSLVLVVYARYLNYKFSSAKELPEAMHAQYYFIVYFAVSIHYLFTMRKLLTIINHEQNQKEQLVA